MPLHHLLRDIGVAAGLSTVGAHVLSREGKPRYIVGALIGIPAAAFVAGSVPWVIGAPIGGAYLGALAGYAAASTLGASQKGVERVAVGAGIIGAIASYL